MEKQGLSNTWRKHDMFIAETKNTYFDKNNL